MLCENAYRRGRGIGIEPQCYANKATKEVTVVYHEYTFIYHEFEETFYLCDECAKALKRDAIKHGYKVKIREL